jgi:hypothetical protein
VLRCSARNWGTALALVAALMVREGETTGAPRPRVVGAADVSWTPKIVFRIHDYAGLSPSILNGTEAQAVRVFRHIGVRTQWEAARCADTRRCSDGGAITYLPIVYVNILPAAMASALDLSKGATGYCVPSSLNGYPHIVNVLYGRAEELARDGPASLDQLLGYVMAHEIGHLLLGSAPHSSTGIMRAHWGMAELKLISQGSLHFGAGQITEIHAAVAHLSAQAASTDSSPYAPTMMTLSSEGPP